MTIFTPTLSETSEAIRKMDIIFFNNDFPGGNLQDTLRRIHCHSKDRRRPMLALFIDEASRAVKEEIRLLPAELKQMIPPFETVFDLAEHNGLREGLLGNSVDGALLVMHQIATYIGYVENNSRDLRDLSNTSLTGLGVGLFASAAVSVSSTLRDLTLAGADAARIAFRLGVYVHSVSQDIEARDPSEPRPDPWAYAIHNVDRETVQRELDIVHSQNERPDAARIFISATSKHSVTVSGPPARLKALFIKSSFFREARSIALPVYGGLCHAPHIYGPHDVATVVRGDAYGGPDASEVVQGDNGIRSQHLVPVVPSYSASTGMPFCAENAVELFENVVAEILTQAIEWNNVVDGVVENALCSNVSEVEIFCFGNSITLDQLQTALKASIDQVSITSLSLWIPQGEQPKGSTPRGPAQSKLAIVGMSCRLPGGATDTEKFWEVLEKGLDVSRKIPSDRFDVESHYDPTGTQTNKTMTQYGCFIDEPGLFDAPFFNMSPREAVTVDPQMRLALVTAYEALERAGVVVNRTASTKTERIGTFYGQAADDYREVNISQDIDTYHIPGSCRAFGPGRINYFFKFAGPSYSIDTACSSGLAAIELACQALWKGEVDTAVAGGVNVLTNSDGWTGLCKGHFLSQGHNACKTWDATADGYCRADGVGSLVIKRLEDAEADNDNILGVILGAGTNHSAQAVSITHPHAGHQAHLARQVLRQAGVDPLDVSYVELHGTGTQAGDVEEMKGIAEVYAPLTRRRGKDQQLHIGAVKANLGHGESVAGTTALIKVLLMLQKSAIPPHVGIKTEINPKLDPRDMERRNIQIPFTMTPWIRREGKTRIAAVNNFGAAGGNTTLVLEDAPLRDSRERDPRSVHVVSLSAKTKASLKANVERLLEYLGVNEDGEAHALADLSYTTTARRPHYGFRLAVAASSTASLKKSLLSQMDKIDSLKAVSNNAASSAHAQPSIAFTFTGQGASYKSMNLELYRDVPAFRHHIHHLDSLAQAQGFPSFVPALDGSHNKNEAHSPVVTQLALVCTEIALARYWSSCLGLQPDIVMGHSLGEYAAMHVAGVTTASDTIFMVGRRAQMMEARCRAGSHTMMAVRASLAKINGILDGYKEGEGKGEKLAYTVACINGPFDTVLSGTKDQMDAVAAPLEAAGYRCIRLDVAFAFHSEQTDPILDDFEALCKAGVLFQEPRLPVISPLLGRIIFDDKTLNARYVRRATREAVDFHSALKNAQAVSATGQDTIWIEIGPHPVCTGFVKSTIPTAVLAVPSMRRGEDNWKTMAESMAALHAAGIELCWDEFHSPFQRSLRLLDLPTYAFTEKNYWFQYNGDWALRKGNTFYDHATVTTAAKGTGFKIPGFETSTVQLIVEESLDGTAGTVVMQSDLMSPDFLEAAHGHAMNNCGVVTSSIHADIAFTLGGYLYKRLTSKTLDYSNMSITDMLVTKGLVAKKDKKTPQLIRVTASTADIQSGIMSLTWQNVDDDGQVQEPFAAANIVLQEHASSKWLSSWTPMAHLVQGRISDLERLAQEGIASRFSHNMAYTLFASNLVTYADKYRGMRSVVMHELEAFADVELTTKTGGTWTAPPFFIDSVAHLAGFIMNCSDSLDTRGYFSVTPGWRCLRLAKSLVAGARFRSYVKMIPCVEDASVYLGDVYILQDDAIVGLVEGIEFRRYPRILIDRFFSAPDKAAVMESKKVKTVASQASDHVSAPIKTSTQAPLKALEGKDGGKDKEKSLPSSRATAEVPAAPSTAPHTDLGSASSSDSIAGKALALIADEAGLELSDMQDDAGFANLGIDSLMSLVITEKLKRDLDVQVGGSLFLDFPTIGDLREWLEELYG